MEVYKVKVFPAAKQDLIDIIRSLNTLSPDIALRYHELFTERISSLSHMPERCPYLHNPVLKAKGYRYLIVGKYLVFFVVSGYTVQIRRIIYGRRNYGYLL